MTLFAAFALWQEQGTTEGGPGLYLHISSIVLGFASLFVASFCAVLYFVQAKLLKLIDPETDSLRFYNLGDRYAGRIEHFGVRPGYDPEGTLLL